MGFWDGQPGGGMIDQNDAYDLQNAYLHKKQQEIQNQAAAGDPMAKQQSLYWENAVKQNDGYASLRANNFWQPWARPQQVMTPGAANMMMGYLGSDPSDPAVARMKAWASSQPSFSMSPHGRGGGMSDQGESPLADPRVHRALMDTHDPVGRMQMAGFGSDSGLMGLARARMGENLNLGFGLGGEQSNFGIRQPQNYQQRGTFYYG